MAAPKENEFWKIRSTHGREKLFASPELLWEAACEYFEWCDEHPFEEEQLFAYQGDVTSANAKKKRPYTLHGLCLYLDCGTAYFRNFRNQERDNKAAFMEVIDKINETIYNQKFSGAASGFFNANIIARDLGLADKSDITTAGESLNKQVIIEQVPTPPLSKNESDVDTKKE